jgi:hypothetical protein
MGPCYSFLLCVYCNMFVHARNEANRGTDIYYDFALTTYPLLLHVIKI